MNFSILFSVLKLLQCFPLSVESHSLGLFFFHPVWWNDCDNNSKQKRNCMEGKDFYSEGTKRHWMQWTSIFCLPKRPKLCPWFSLNKNPLRGKRNHQNTKWLWKFFQFEAIWRNLMILPPSLKKVSVSYWYWHFWLYLSGIGYSTPRYFLMHPGPETPQTSRSQTTRMINCRVTSQPTGGAVPRRSP